MQMNGFFKNTRLVIALIISSLCFIIIYSRYADLAFSKKHEQRSLSPMGIRGSIFDRRGNPLANQTSFYDFSISPDKIKSPKQFAQAVSTTLMTDPAELEKKLTLNKDKKFLYIQKKLTEEQYDVLKNIISENGWSPYCRFDSIPSRIYPEDERAMHLVGYLGKSGIEYSQDEILSPVLSEETEGTVYGKDIFLTIDKDLQFKLERIAADSFAETTPQNLMIIAADSKTGEILSYISLPSENLNEYTSKYKYGDDRYKNYPADFPYEPGSTFKIFTAAIALNEGVITADKTYVCDGVYPITSKDSQPVRLTCLEHHGSVNVRKALEVSCNEFFYQASENLSNETFLKYLDKFGFGKQTGVEFSSESSGKLHSADSYWSLTDKPTMAIGQGISVSALQMVQAATAIANGGKKVKLTFIRRIQDHDKNIIYDHKAEYGESVVSPSVASYILDCMRTTTQKGTGTKANLKDISIATKTGTGQIWDEKKKSYSKTDYVSNCISIFPAEDPQIILYIVIERAVGESYAGRIVAPVIAKAADVIIDHLGLNRADAPSVEHSGKIKIQDTAPVRIGKTVPDFNGKSKSSIYPLMNEKDVNFILKGEGWVYSQNPPAGTPVTKGMTIELLFK